MTIFDTNLKPCYRKGKIIPNGISLEKHENDTVVYFTEYGFDVELIEPTNTPKSKNPDIIMAGLVWEMKSPQGQGKNNIDNIFRKAAKQSENIIFDLRRYPMKKIKKAITNIQRRFNSSHRIRRLCIITTDGKLIYLKKS